MAAAAVKLAACSDAGGLNPMTFSDQHGGSVMERMKYLREMGRFCDLWISVRERQFAAHRNVLSACSPYFDSILRSDRIVKETVTVNCPNPYAFELFLNYMYSGDIVIDRSVVVDLLKLSNNFLVTRLKHYCAEYMDRYLDAANCLTIRQLAQKYNLPTLLKASGEFFDININQCLLESVDILNYSLVQINKLLQDPKYSDAVSPDVHLKLIVRWVNEDIEHREANFKEMLAHAPVHDCSAHTLEFLLDYAPLFTKSMNARYLLLKTMVENQQMVAKYEEQYQGLCIQIGNEEASYEGEGDDDGGDSEDMEGEQMDGESYYGSEGESTMDAPVDGHPTTDEVLESGARYDGMESGGTKLRIKISLGPPRDSAPSSAGLGEASSGSETGSGRRRKISRKHKLSAKKRGRPPKRITDEDVDMAAFDEDELDGVYADSSYLQGTITYTEEDALDPQTVEDGEEISDPQGSHPCTYCRFASNSEEETARHCARKHNRNVIFICPIPGCEFECNWSRPFYQHVSQHFEGPPYNCNTCAFVSDDCLDDILSHIITHTEDRFFKCALCGFRGRTRTQIWAHEKMHSDEAALHCIECGRSFNAQAALDLHMDTHSHPRPHICDECGFASKSADHILAHKKGHNGDVFYCHIEGCDYSSPKKSQLAAHLRTHMAVRAHMCKQCGRGFIEKSHLVRHERIHLEDKPFKCDACDYASSRRDKLKEHILKHHNGAVTSKAHRRRYKRARQLAALAAQEKMELGLTGQETSFRPIDPAEHVEQWQAHNQQYQPYSPLQRASSAHGIPGPSHQMSPGSMSMMNMNVHHEPIMQGGMGMNIAPRSPHNHSETFACNTPTDLHNRPMSLPPYGGQPQQPGVQQNQQPDQQMPPQQVQHQQWMW